MSDYVVDTSVFAKWILSGEPYEETALKLKEDNVKALVSLHSPSISLYELGNVLWKAVRKARVSSDDALKALEAITSMRLNFHELNQDDISQTFKIANLLNLTVYDASYVHLSNKLSMPLLTADEKLSAISKPGYKVVHLKNY